jgi:hypothetical protein
MFQVRQIHAPGHDKCRGGESRLFYNGLRTRYLVGFLMWLNRCSALGLRKPRRRSYPKQIAQKPFAQPLNRPRSGKCWDPGKLTHPHLSVLPSHKDVLARSAMDLASGSARHQNAPNHHAVWLSRWPLGKLYELRRPARVTPLRGSQVPAAPVMHVPLRQGPMIAVSHGDCAHFHGGIIRCHP